MARPSTRAQTRRLGPLPFLPNEISLHIIRLSLPESPCSNTYSWQDNSRSFRDFALVDRTWQSLAQAELFAFI
jgi:hypothetical protein